MENSLKIYAQHTDEESLKRCAPSLVADYKKTKNIGMPIFLYVFADIRAYSLAKFQILKKGLILRI